MPKNKIVPITIGINDNDIRMIGESIMEAEQKKFDELVAKHLKNPSCILHEGFFVIIDNIDEIC